MKREPLRLTDFKDIDFFKRGKVRDVYDLKDKLLIVSTDRISCFDVVLPTCIPNKGEVLTRLSLFWFELTKDIVPNHLISADVNEYPQLLLKYKDILKDRSMLVKKTKPIAVECVVRGYLSGSGWKEYRQTGSVCGTRLPAGLKESDKLPEPLFTPAIKAQTGHDENISFERAAELVGAELAGRLRDRTLEIYRRAADYAATRGVLVADTKFEFGFIDGILVLADEVLTPDSSRFWPAETYRPGGAQPSYDKQYVRDYLESIQWAKQPPAPPLPDEVARRTSEKYKEAYRAITGKNL